MRHIIIYIVLLFGSVSCNQQLPADRTKRSNVIQAESTLDSVFEQFEDQAYNNRELYVSNPDSFTNSIQVEPISDYQKEMYTYGLIFIGYSLMENGNVYDSIKYYEKAYNYAKKESISIDDINNTIIKPLSNLYTRINDTEKAIHLLQNSIANTKDTEQLIGLKNNLANAYLFNYQLDKAEQTLIECLETTNSENKALLYNSLASIYNEKKDIPNSIKYNNLAIRGFEKKSLKNDTLLWYISALGLQAQLHQEPKFSQKALKLLYESFPNTQNRFKAKLISTEADILQSQNHPNQLKKYNEIINLFSTDKLNNTLDYTYTKSLLQKAKYFNQSEQIDSALHYYELGILNDFKTQQLITSPKDQIQNNLFNKKTIEELIELIDRNENLKSNPIVIRQLLWCIELSKARLLINEINRSDQWNKSNNDTKIAVQKIQTLYTEKDDTKDPLKKQHIQNLIDQLLMEFQLSEKYFETIRFTPNKELFFEKLSKKNTDYYSYYIHTDKKTTVIQSSYDKISYHQIKDQQFLPIVDDFKNDYFGESPNEYNINQQKYKTTAQQITRSLLPELEQKNVFISLDGNLYGLPFDALYKNDFLVNKHNFAYLNSFLLFNILDINSKNKSTISVLYRSEYSPPLPSLTFIDKEIENISAQFRTEKIGTKEQTEEVLKQQFAKSNIIHIAAHTILDSTEAPMIYLKKIISTNQIRYFEIKSPLVFLSACNTGSGESLPSEGTESIQRVFLSKNVPSVISTYWLANDETMLKITDNFYRLLHQTKDPIHALAETKRQYLTNANNRQKNPWYWANINYAGVENTIQLKKTPNYYAIGVIGILSLCLLYRYRKKLKK